jgi:hypothetical protein
MGEKLVWGWREVLKGAGMILAIGIAWGTLMSGIRGTHDDLKQMEARTAAVEKYLISVSKGQFIPATQDDPR